MKTLFALLLFLTLLAPAQASADEKAGRMEVTLKVFNLVHNKAFAELDALAKSYRDSESRTNSGVWHLTIFYDALGAPSDVILSDEDYKAAFNTFDEWIKASPSSPTPYIGKASMLASYAWKFRGNKMADEVPIKDFAPFFYHLGEAKKLLEKSKEVSSQDPEWYAQMAYIMMGLNTKEDEFDAVVDEGLKKYPYYYPIYFNTALHLLPVWGGTVEKIEAFALKAIERTKEKEGMGVYSRIYWYLGSIQYDLRLFLDTKVDWLKMKQGIKDVLEKYPDQWNINNFGYFSCIQGDKEMTKELIDRITPFPVKDVWGEESFFLHCKAL